MPNIFEENIVMAGNQHKSGQGTSQQHEDFEKSLYALYPIHEISEEWSNEDYFTFDYLPLIGKLDKHNADLLFASGYNAWGNTTSNMAAKILSAYLLDQYSNYAMLTSPQRTSFFSLPFLKENMNTAVHFIKSKLQKGEFDYPLKKEAKQMEIDGHLYGVYRDEQDELFIVDITCHIWDVSVVLIMWIKPGIVHVMGHAFPTQVRSLKGPAGYHLHAIGDDLNTVDPHVTKNRN